MSSSASTSLLVVHYHEIGLKGRNRGFFERALVRSIERVLTDCRVEVIPGRLVVHLSGSPASLENVFGISSVAAGVSTGATMQEMSDAALNLMTNRVGTFAISARRATKDLPFTSTDINVTVGEVVRTQLNLAVDLSHPDHTVNIEVMGRRALVTIDKIAGPGGLPTGVSGRLACLVSGGLDSPVAVYQMLRRGAKGVLVHFHSEPFTDRSSVRKVLKLAEIVSKWQGPTTVVAVAFGDTQQQIVAGAPPALRVVLYRRFMVRIAAEIAAWHRCKALVTGDSLGQVASQTLENLICVDDASPIPIFRPLIGQDKQDVINQAKAIGTHDLSLLPDTDCCSLFVPRSPATRARIEDCLKAEGELHVPELVSACIERAEIFEVKV